MRRLFSTFLISVLVFKSFAVVPLIRDVAAKQRFPWSGKVDVSFCVTSDLAINLAPDKYLEISVSATDRTTGVKYVASTNALTGDVGAEEGVHHIVWDLGAQGIIIKSTNVIFTVDAIVRFAVENYDSRLYCILDISAGTNALSYPVSLPSNSRVMFSSVVR